MEPVATLRHPRFFRCWIRTGTSAAHTVKPSVTLSEPRPFFPWIVSVTARA